MFLLSGAVQAQSSQAESKSWQPYSIAGEKFSVALPLLPALHLNYEFLEALQNSRRIYSLGAYADGVVYVIQVAENPKRIQSLESFLKERKIPEATFANVKLDGFAGKEMRFQDIVARFFAVNERLYEFKVVGAPLDDPRVTRFFSSVSLHRKAGIIEVVNGPGLPYEPAIQVASSDETKQLFTGKEVDKKVRLGMKPEPSYTEEARRNQITGTVVLKCVFAANGAVTNIRVMSGLPYGLKEQAIDASRKIKFIPAIKDGKYVSMWMQLEYNFNLY